MISNNVDIIMVDPITPDGSGIALTNAVEAGIPVIIYDGYWTDGEEKAVTTVTWDQKATGTLVGEYFVNYVKENNGGKCRVVELTNAVSTHCQERFVGLHEVIDAANADGCEIEILNKYDSQATARLHTTQSPPSSSRMTTSSPTLTTARWAQLQRCRLLATPTSRSSPWALTVQSRSASCMTMT